MVRGKILNRDILRLALPAIATNITVPLLGLSDTVIAGHLPGEQALAAIAVGSMMMNVVFWLFGFLRMGTTGLTAQEYGNKNDNNCRVIFSRSFFLAISIGLIIIILSKPLSYLLIEYIKPDSNIISPVRDYFSICIFGAPAILSTMSVQGWFLGMQTSFYPMIISISVNIVNIILSVVFVFLSDMGFIGLAYGTLGSNWFGVILALTLAHKFRKGETLWCDRRQLFKKGALSKFFHVNSDIFFRSACILIVSMSVTSFGAQQGTLILGANAVMMQFFHFFSYFMDGFAFAAEAETGKYAGSGDVRNLRKSFKILLGWSAGIAGSFFLIYLFFWQPITRLITDSATIRATIADFRVWLWLIPPLTVAAFIFDGAYIGLTATRRMLVTTITASVTFFAVALINISYVNGFEICIQNPENNRLWGAFISYLMVRGIMLAIQYPHVSSEKYIKKELC